MRNENTNENNNSENNNSENNNSKNNTTIISLAYKKENTKCCD